MCGFAGFISAQPSGIESLEGLATRMATAIAHRGPDDAGAWADAQAGECLGEDDIVRFEDDYKRD